MNNVKSVPLNPENTFIDEHNPAFWVATHLYNKDTYVVYRLVGGTIHEEVLVEVRDRLLKPKAKLTPQEQLYFKRKKLI